MHSLVASNKILMDDLTLVIAPSLLERIQLLVPFQLSLLGMNDWIQETSPPSRAMAFDTATPPAYALFPPAPFSPTLLLSKAREPHPQPCSSSITKDQQPPAKKSRFSALTEQKLEVCWNRDPVWGVRCTVCVVPSNIQYLAITLSLLHLRGTSKLLLQSL